MVTVIGTIKAIFMFFLSLWFVNFFLLNLGGKILDLFPNHNFLYYMFQAFRYLLIIFMLFFVPMMEYRGKGLIDKTMKVMGG